jgi:uncharacterized OsmC-like protein
MKTATTPQALNGIDTAFVRATIEAIKADPSKAESTWRVATYWKGGTRSDTRVTAYDIGGERVEKDFTIRIDEPAELGGTNKYANPQEYLLGAMNACITVQYAVVCALYGIELEELWIETEGDIDLRGFLAIDRSVPPGYDSISYTVHMKGNATPEQFEQVHHFVGETAPNRYNIGQAIPLNTRLVIEQ